jgi:phage shock protein PspC (stress-responsive transcriptional regulator)
MNSHQECTMALSDELAKLQDLHQRGALPDDEFTRAKARLLDDAKSPAGTPPPSDALASLNALRRSRSDRWLAGVCGGIARATGMESWLTRLLFAVLLLFGGTGLVVYLLLWIFVPNE